MDLRITKEWLESHRATDEGYNVEAGSPEPSPSDVAEYIYRAWCDEEGAEDPYFEQIMGDMTAVRVVGILTRKLRRIVNRFDDAALQENPNAK